MSKKTKGSTLKPIGKKIHSTHNSPSSNPKGKVAAPKKNKAGMPGSGLPNIPCYTAPH